MNDCTLEHSSENRKSFRICNDVGLSTHPRRHKRSLVREGFVRLVSSKPDGKKKLPLLTNGAKYVRFIGVGCKVICFYYHGL